MRSKAFFVTTAALVLCASTTLASADDRSRSRYPEYRGSERGDRGSANVAALADRIEDTAAAIHREYDRNNRRPDRSEARVKSNLRELWQEANQFESQVGRYRNDSRNGGRELDDLIEAYYDTADSLRHISPRPYVDRGMDQIGDMIAQLSRHYGNGRYDRNDRGRGRYDDRGRGDRGRYDRQYEHDDGRKH